MITNIRSQIFIWSVQLLFVFSHLVLLVVGFRNIY